MVPPRRLETLLRILLPPASREHVLGDLQERNKSLKAYSVDALSVLAPVIISRIRRTTDIQAFLTEALTIYLSFAAAAWFLGEQRVLPGDAGLLGLAAPTIIAAVALLFCNAYSDLEKQNFLKPILQSAGCLSIGLLVQAIILDMRAGFAIPPRTLLYGGALAFLLLSPLRAFFPPAQKRLNYARSSGRLPLRNQPFTGTNALRNLRDGVTRMRGTRKSHLVFATFTALLTISLIVLCFAMYRLRMGSH